MTLASKFMVFTSPSFMTKAHNTALKPIVVMLALFAVLALGFFVRFDNLGHWRSNPERYFFGEQQNPLTLTVDAYYFMDAARDISHGRYTALDEDRLAPTGYQRSAWPPLISLVLAGVTLLTGISLEWGAVLLPPFFSLFLGIAAFLLGRELGMRVQHRLIDERYRRTSAEIMGLATALATLLSPALANRGTVGWFDTDTLNVAFVISAAFLSLRFNAAKNGKGQALWFTLGGFNLLLFIWWWHTTTLVPLALAGLPMLLAVLLVARRSIRQLALWFVLGLVLLLIAAVAGEIHIYDPVWVWNYISSMWLYITGDTGGHSSFSVAAAAGSEQFSVISLTAFAQSVTGTTTSLVIGITGLCFLIFTGFRSLWSLASLIFVAALSFTANRFLIFAAPLFGLGVGAMAFFLWLMVSQTVQRFSQPADNKSFSASFADIAGKGVVLSILAGLALVAPYEAIQAQNSTTPRRHPVLLQAMADLRNHTPENAVIWASWGHGHPLVFYSERAAIADGNYHPAETVYALNLPLAAREDRFAANWIHFFATHGIHGMHRANSLFGTSEDDWASGIKALRQLLGAGPEGARIIVGLDYHFTEEKVDETLSFLFPPNPRPLYLFVDYLQVRQNIFFWGLWDPATKSAPQQSYLGQFYNLRQTAPGVFTALYRGRPTTIDLIHGTLTTNNETIPIRGATIRTASNSETVSLHLDASMLVTLFPQSRSGIIGPEYLMDTVYTRLFFEQRYDGRYFQPVDVRPERGYGVWRVTADSLP
jgi:dolichyl-diphosphooligosaccharide--protein glycosyltransferase